MQEHGSNDNITALATYEPRDYTEQQKSLIKQACFAKGIPDAEFGVFLAIARRTGLDPLARQIYAIPRNERAQDDEGKWGTRTAWTIQTGIDGYRLIAARSGHLAGIDDAEYDTETGEHPERASVTVWRFVQGVRVSFSATARWREYAVYKDEYGEDRKKTGNKVPSGMWAKMPWLMLGKCAEALALRKAFPAELSGVYTGEEMEQADNPPVPPVTVSEEPTRPAPAKATNGSGKTAARGEVNWAPTWRRMAVLGIKSLADKDTLAGWAVKGKTWATLTDADLPAVENALTAIEKKRAQANATVDAAQSAPAVDADPTPPDDEPEPPKAA